MESDSMKDLWNEENKQLDQKLNINEDALRKKAIDKSVSESDNLLSFSILGRYLALVYFVISIVTVIPIIDQLLYSVPAVLGGLAMLWSFRFHRTLKKQKYESTSIIELQKLILQFRIYTARTTKYDAAVVIFWLLTLAPVVLHRRYDFHVYASMDAMLIFLGAAFVSLASLSLFCYGIYKTYELKLKTSEEALQRLIEFEKN